MNDPLLRSKQVYQTSGTTITATFDETTAVDSTCLLVATVEVSNATVVTAPSGWTTVSGGGANGSSSQVRMFIRQGDASTNSISVTIPSSQSVLTIMAFSGYVSLTPLSSTGSTANSGSTYNWTAIPGNLYAQSYVVIDTIGVSNTVTWQGTDAVAVYNSTDSTSIANSSQRSYTIYKWAAANAAMASQLVSWTTSRTSYVMQAVLPILNPQPSSAVPNIVGSSANGIGYASGTFTVTPPAGAVKYLAFTYWDKDISTGITPPSGWTEVAYNGSDANGKHYSPIFSALASGSPGTSWTVPTQASNGAMNSAAVVIIGYDHDFDVLNSAWSTGTGIAPSLTPIRAALAARPLATWQNTNTTRFPYPTTTPYGHAEWISNGTANVMVAHDEIAANVSSGTTAWGGTAWDNVATVLIANTIVAPTISTTVLDSMYQGSVFSQTLIGAGSPTPTWVVTTGSVPAGLTLSTAGVLSGTPTTPGAYSFTVTATNTSGSASQAYSGTVYGPNRLVRSKTVYQTTGTTVTATFAETPALDNTNLLVAIISLASSTAIATPSGWTALAGNGNNGGNQVRTFIKQGDGSTNGITFTVASANATVVLAAFAGYSGLTPLSSAGSNAAVAETSQSMTFTASTGNYGIALNIVGVAGAVTWGSVTNGTRIGASTGSTALANAGQLLSVAATEFTGTSVTSTQSWTTSRQPRLMTVVLPLANLPVLTAPYIAAAGTPVSATSSSTLSVPVPTGVAVGDLIIITLGAEWNATTLPDASSVSVSGFTVASVAAFQSYTSYTENTFILYKYATAVDTGTYSVAFNPTTVTQSAGVASIVRGGPTSGNPFTDTFHSSHSVGSTSVNVATFTPTDSNSLLIGSVWCDDTVLVTSYPSGWVSQANTTSGNGMMLTTTQQAAPTATGSLTWNMASGSPDPVVLIGTIRAPLYVPPNEYIAINFDEGAGTTVHDYSGNGFDFNLADTSRWTSSGKTNGGLGYGSNTGYAARQLTQDIANGTAPFAVMMWVNPANTAQSDSGLIGNTALDLEFDAGHIYGDGFGTTTTSYPANTWTHVTWVADGTNRIIYANGVSVLSVPGGYISGWGHDGFIGIGGTDDTNNFNGVIDDLRVFTSVITAKDIAYFMNLPVKNPSASRRWYVKTGSGLTNLTPYLLSPGGLIALDDGIVK